MPGSPFLRLAHSVSLILIFSSSALAQGSTSDQDQLGNFCRRFAHQTTWMDNKLYVDGGYIDYGGQIDDTTVNYTNTQLLWADTSTVNKDLFPPMSTSLPKPNNVPSVAGGALWKDEVNKVFYLFGGEYNWTSPPPQSYTLWLFDTVYNTWNATSTDSSSLSSSPPSFGASAVDQNRGNAYYYGGWKSNATEVGFPGEPQLQSGLVQFDLNEKTWRSSQTFIDDSGRAEGAMFYLPISDAGMLVYFGGVVAASNGSNGTMGSPMDTIYLYDIGTQTSYSQRTSGTPPAMRRRFCGGASWPDDRSSFNIYIFGGLSPYEEEGYGLADAWILSLPSFTWTILYNSTSYSHHSLSCDVVNKGQMIIMGGYFPNSTNNACDVPSIWGMHNLNLGSNNILGASWYQYQPNLTEYTLPPNLTAVVGGSATGGATLRAPPGGFDSEQLGVYMGRVAPEGQRNATRVIPSKAPSATSAPGGGTNVGAIVGGVIGGVAGLLILLAVVFLCFRRRKRRAEPTVTHEAPDTSQMGEASTVGHPSVYGSPQDPNKRDFSGRSWASSLGISSYGGSPEHSPQPSQTNWQPAPINPQQYYPPPPQAQPFYPRPPQPQQYGSEEQSSVAEMPSVRSPTNVEDVRSYRNGGSPLARRTGPTIHEE